MAVITRERWLKATPAQRYNWATQGHVMPSELEVLQNDPTITLDGKSLAKPKPIERPPAPTVDWPRAVKQLEDAGLSREVVRGILEVNPSIYQNAKSTADVVANVTKAQTFYAGMLESRASLVAQQAIAGEIDGVDALKVLVNELSLPESDPRVAAVWNDLVADDPSYAELVIEELREDGMERLQAEADQRLADQGRAAHRASEQSKVEMAEKVDAVEKYIDGLDPALMEQEHIAHALAAALSIASQEGRVPEIADLESAVKFGTGLVNAETRARARQAEADLIDAALAPHMPKDPTGREADLMAEPTLIEPDYEASLAQIFAEREATVEEAVEEALEGSAEDKAVAAEHERIQALAATRAADEAAPKYDHPSQDAGYVPQGGPVNVDIPRGY